MRVKPLLAFGLAFLFGLDGAWSAAGAPAGKPCAFPDGGEPVRLSGLDRHGDLMLADGRILRLAGLMPRQSEADRARLAAALAPFMNRDARLSVLGPADRWGRLPARLLPEPEEPASGKGADLTARLLAAGAVLRMPESGQPECNEFWRQAERGGLAGRAAPDNAAATGLMVVDGHDPAAMKAHAGRIVVVEGRIASVGERARRTYLNFSRRRGKGASIVMSSQLWRELQGAGWTVVALTGKRVRVRGVVEGLDGLLIEAASRAALEMVD